ncbi:hypothetical protein AXG93_673s1730 [Marchantia polymorpha subsp. ruderalis]|uniref:Uncharacterized protein n=1 Tax=Marchantia polymorpha subsp. ruderalis TaxID=1480154 RepID=A0A176WKW8_MARPO|nr:hypothetical protein AXG93_673s1730 [Marchantia polymorpha subsp. ruderalis]
MKVTCDSDTEPVSFQLHFIYPYQMAFALAFYMCIRIEASAGKGMESGRKFSQGGQVAGCQARRTGRVEDVSPTSDLLRGYCTPAASCQHLFGAAWREAQTSRPTTVEKDCGDIFMLMSDQEPSISWSILACLEKLNSSADASGPRKEREFELQRTHSGRNSSERERER